MYHQKGNSAWPSNPSKTTQISTAIVTSTYGRHAPEPASTSIWNTLPNYLKLAHSVYIQFKFSNHHTPLLNNSPNAFEVSHS